MRRKHTQFFPNAKTCAFPFPNFKYEGRNVWTYECIEIVYIYIYIFIYKIFDLFSEKRKLVREKRIERERRRNLRYESVHDGGLLLYIIIILDPGYAYLCEEGLARGRVSSYLYSLRCNRFGQFRDRRVGRWKLDNRMLLADIYFSLFLSSLIQVTRRIERGRGRGSL